MSICVRRRLRPLSVAISSLVLLLCSATAAMETEPNDSCIGAQDVGAPVLPLVIEGELAEPGDIDFFRISAAPGSPLQVDLEGAPTGAGTLADPLLGIFDPVNCTAVFVVDDGGEGGNARHVFLVPDAGEVVIAATAFPDFGFIGSGSSGTYTLTVARAALVNSIATTLVNANTLEPLRGDADPFARATLFRCNLDNCFQFVGFQFADSAGAVRFENELLTAGRYALFVEAFGFNSLSTPPFDAGEGEDVDPGPLALSPLSVIGSVSGRLVDSLGGEPLPGNAPPFAGALLERCLEFGCFGVAFASPDQEGRFSIDGRLFQLPPGDYRVMASASDFSPATSAIFSVAEAQDIDIGDLALKPFPIQFGDVQTCALPIGGGACNFGIQIRNRSGQRFRGEAWGRIDFFPSTFPFQTSLFQVGRGGAHNPRPQALNLRTGATSLLDFSVNVPGSVPDGSSICGSVFVGQNPDALFNVVGARFLFCTQKQGGAFRTLNEKEGRRLWRERRGSALEATGAMPERARGTR